jgi:hypothetical protein
MSTLESERKALSVLFKGYGIYNPNIKKKFDKPIIWTDDLANELHKPIIKKFPKRKVIVFGIDHIWAADLVDMSSMSKENKGIKFLLAVIDIFSKFGWMIPLKNKSGLSVSEAFEKIFKMSSRKPKLLWVDKGKEFYNKNMKTLLKENEIEIYSTENEEKSCIVERWNGTMKQKMFKYFTANDTNKYYNVLDELVNVYNNTKHSSIKMTPVEASNKENESTVHENLYEVKMNDSESKKNIAYKPKFAVSDRVRITKKKGTFEKGYTNRWTREIFVVSEVLKTIPITYKIVDLKNEEIIGSFYEQELQKTIF